MLSPAKQALVNVMLVDCALAAGRGVGTKKVSLKAAKFWATSYKKSFGDALHNKANYVKDRNGVLLMGLKLGRTARKLAGTKKAIGKAEAKKASKIISLDKSCGAGGGQYCPPGGLAG